MPTLTEKDVRQLDPARIIAAIENAFRDRYLSISMPPRTHIPLTGGTFLIMPCYDRHNHVIGMKLVTVRGAQSKDRIQATYLLIDPQTARSQLTIPANYLTDLRTAATSAVATKFLARGDARVLGIFGAGRQARAHIKIVPLVRQFDKILVCGKDAVQTREFARQVSAETNLPVYPASPRACAVESDVICTCTTSQTPLFDGNLLRSGTHLNLVGTFQPHAREVDLTTIQRSHVIVDTYEAALAEAGDLLIPIKEGAIKRDHILADLHELLSGKTVVRHDPADITLFKSVGCALEDLVTAELLV